MRISKHDLEKMNDLVGKGKTIVDISKQFDKYDYWEIYSEVEDYSFLGKKRSISNRLKKLEKNQPVGCAPRTFQRRLDFWCAGRTLHKLMLSVY